MHAVYVLIVFVYGFATSVGGIEQSPAVAMHNFSSKATCERTVKEIQKVQPMYNGLPTMGAFCVRR